MRTTPVDRLAHLGRLLLLLGALLAVGTLGAWTAAPDWIDQVDADLVAAHVGEAEARDAELLARADADPEAMSALAERQVEALEGRKPD